MRDVNSRPIYLRELRKQNMESSTSAIATEGIAPPSPELDGWMVEQLRSDALKFELNFGGRGGLCRPVRLLNGMMLFPAGYQRRRGIWLHVKGLPRTSQSEGVFDSTLVAILSYEATC